MSNSFKALYRGAATTGSSNLYTVPSATTTYIMSIVVTNTSATGGTFSLSLDGVSIATSVSIPANDSIFLEPKQVLSATKIIAGSASATTINFHISGLEITT